MRPRNTRPRGLSSLVTLALTGVAAATTVVPAHAVTVPCDTAALIAAINNANTNVDPVIDLEPYCLYEVTAPYMPGADDGLPPITNNNPGGVTINGHNATIKRVGSTPFRLFEVGVVTPAAAPGRLTLNDLTVMNGQPGINIGGGAVLVRNNSTFAGTNVAFQGGTANIGGGARFMTGSTATLTDSRISDNRTTGGASSGGGLQSEGQVTLVNTHVTSNRARIGGGIGHPSGTLTINGGSVKHNTAFDAGGGISSDASGTLNVTGTSITDNRVTTGGLGSGTGGGVFIGAGGTQNFTNSTIEGNTVTVRDATDGGGGIFALAGALTLDNTKVKGNKLIGEGGLGAGISAFGGTVNLMNASDVTGNLAAGRYSLGGGIYTTGLINTPTVTVNRSAIDRNKVSGTGSRGAGIYNAGGTYDLTDASVQFNVAPDAPAPGGIWTSTAITSVTNTTIANNTPTNCLYSPAPVTSCVG
ncbi:hypothetical protein [Streptomyces sp. NRRL S-237]|uniref:hypothetical protein n=1 Tax=Streptomyces sp. NRRL S-237 TaxID=1463895 RepID=UPI0004C6A032|nr:hypothetical protein [Streptomyces sp. NRRL S-237]